MKSKMNYLFVALLYCSFINCNLIWAQQSLLNALPRFASIRPSKCNLHAGPGQNYPTEWQIVCPNLPVEIVAEFDNWRQIVDFQQTKGWVHKNLLSSRRFVIINKSLQIILDKPEVTAQEIARVEGPLVVRLLKAQTNWCLISFKHNNTNYKGWIKRDALWGLYPAEIIE